jgi:hypothetical protein
MVHEGISPTEEKRRITERINATKSVHDLIYLYNVNPDYQQDLFDKFVKKREQLQALAKRPVNQISENGTVIKDLMPFVVEVFDKMLKVMECPFITE